MGFYRKGHNHLGSGAVPGSVGVVLAIAVIRIITR